MITGLKTLPLDIAWKIQNEFTIIDILIDGNTLTLKTLESGVGKKVKELLNDITYRINSDLSYNGLKMGNMIPTKFEDNEISFRGKIYAYK